MSPSRAGGRRDRDQFLFVALDVRTKLIPSFVVGKRTRENTEAYMLDLDRRVVRPDPA